MSLNFLWYPRIIVRNSASNEWSRREMMLTFGTGHTVNTSNLIREWRQFLLPIIQARLICSINNYRPFSSFLYHSHHTVDFFCQSNARTSSCTIISYIYACTYENILMYSIQNMNGYSIRIGTSPQDSLPHIKATSDSTLVCNIQAMLRYNILITILSYILNPLPFSLALFLPKIIGRIILRNF